MCCAEFWAIFFTKKHLVTLLSGVKPARAAVTSLAMLSPINNRGRKRFEMLSVTGIGESLAD
jgi:hypothetical protein